jgi:hypothetical protein
MGATAPSNEREVFNYAGMSPKCARTLRSCAARIRQHDGKITRHIFEIGKTLVEAKTLLPHGYFSKWLDAEFCWPERTAQRYMQVARVLGDKADTVSDLPAAALYNLAAKSTPDELRDEILEQLEAGKAPPNRELTARLKAARLEARDTVKADLPGIVPSSFPRPASGRLPAVAAMEAAKFIIERMPREALEEMRFMLDGADPRLLHMNLIDWKPWG